MNAAFVLLTSAWLAGADAAPAAPPAAAAAPAPAVVATGAGCAGGCGSSCDADPCCESGGRKKRFGGLFGKLKGRKGGDECCETAAPVCCEAPKPVCCAPAPKPVCCEAPKPVCCAPAPKPVCCAPAPTTDCCEDPCAKAPRQGFFSKLKGKFGKKKGDDCCDAGCDACTSGCGTVTPAPAPAVPTPAPGTQPQKMPTTIGGAPAVITPAKIGSEGRNPFDLARRYHGKARASADYSQLTGQLFFVHTDGGRWVVRYAPISQEDRYGGSVVIARDINMNAFKEGDLIDVEGEVLADRGNIRLGGALYRASRMNLVERGQGTTDE